MVEMLQNSRYLLEDNISNKSDSINNDYTDLFIHRSVLGRSLMNLALDLHKVQVLNLKQLKAARMATAQHDKQDSNQKFKTTDRAAAATKAKSPDNEKDDEQCYSLLFVLVVAG